MAVKGKIDGDSREALGREGVANRKHKAPLAHQSVAEDDNRYVLARGNVARHGHREGHVDQLVAAVSAQRPRLRIERKSGDLIVP